MYFVLNISPIFKMIPFFFLTHSIWSFNLLNMCRRANYYLLDEKNNVANKNAKIKH